MLSTSSKEQTLHNAWLCSRIAHDDWYNITLSLGLLDHPMHGAIEEQLTRRAQDADRCSHCDLASSAITITHAIAWQAESRKTPAEEERLCLIKIV